eukprot:CAMPEP_0172495582 /NCGR_PEP_ID=MMETSP1066-20121228/71834_1 /TAXON_ID=671091 /ORGANISM="Coscinodiscus wailesii, Strain CCMP2513" /LENGTH=163 /DNA_ID=CAMNT_0013267339 /DNA_START=118 /DNA_END=609 /DNA_ORIENTATION=+
MKIVALSLVASASAFSPATFVSRQSTALFNGPVKGAGGMFDTRDPEAFEHDDPRKSIKAAPSFEEYLKMRDGGGAPAPAPAAPVAAASAPAAWAPPPAAPAPAAWTPPAPAAPAAPAAHSSGPAKGAGGMFDTRDPEAFEHEDPRKSIKAAPSFEEYLKSRQN